MSEQTNEHDQGDGTATAGTTAAAADVTSQEGVDVGLVNQTITANRSVRESALATVEDIATRLERMAGNGVTNAQVIAFAGELRANADGMARSIAANTRGDG